MGTATILVVDEERKIREVVRSYLELEGVLGPRGRLRRARARVGVAVRSGPRGRSGLPDLSGEEVARTLRTASNVPIIMLTATRTSRSPHTPPLRSREGGDER